MKNLRHEVIKLQALKEYRLFAAMGIRELHISCPMLDDGSHLCRPLCDSGSIFWRLRWLKDVFREGEDKEFFSKPLCEVCAGYWVEDKAWVEDEKS